MKLVDMQRRMVRLGKIRTGEQVASGNGRKRPTKLEHWRITSPSRENIEGAASVYGGKVQPWADAPGGPQWQVTTEADTLKVIIPPGDQLDQSYELWSGGGCQRRCDGRVNVLTGEACLCPSDPAERRDLAANGQACKVTTRLNVVLPDVPGFGTWLLESHGWYAAVELAGTAEFLSKISGEGAAIPARLRLDQREVKRPNEPVRRFAVPVIEVSARVSDLMHRSEALPSARQYVALAPQATPAAPSWGEEPPLDEPETEAGTPVSVPASTTGEDTTTPTPVVAPSRCEGFDVSAGACKKDTGHSGHHQAKDGSSWAS